jgi:N utilization substance protein B
MPKVHENTLSRKSAVQVLYAGALRGANAALLLKNGEIVCMDQPVNDYAVFLVEGVEKHKEELDRQLAGVSENWTLDRMPVLDLAILRLALFEMLIAKMCLCQFPSMRPLSWPKNLVAKMTRPSL